MCTTRPKAAKNKGTTKAKTANHTVLQSFCACNLAPPLWHGRRQDREQPFIDWRRQPSTRANIVSMQDRVVRQEPAHSCTDFQRTAAYPGCRLRQDQFHTCPNLLLSTRRAAHGTLREGREDGHACMSADNRNCAFLRSQALHLWDASRQQLQEAQAPTLFFLAFCKIQPVLELNSAFFTTWFRAAQTAEKACLLSLLEAPCDLCTEVQNERCQMMQEGGDGGHLAQIHATERELRFGEWK